MIIDNATLEKVAVHPSGFPISENSEIAFVGKSNVGKSSLINCMVNRKALARTSSAPGKTRTINFFLIENKFYFVDLPGYGYAKVSKSEKDKWGMMIENYLKNRVSLKAILLLIDIRHEPGENDKLMYEWFKYYGHKIIIVATKSDKIKRSQIQKNTSIIRKTLGLSNETIIPFSSDSKDGRDALWSEINAVLDENNTQASDETIDNFN